MSKLEVYFLGHSGFAIELNDKLLIFDYYIDDNNVLTKLFPKNHKKYFFSSHNHHDHYNEEILKYASANTYYILSDDIVLQKNISNVNLINPDNEIIIGDITVKTIGSTDAGVAFIVQFNDWTIFHAGDLNWWHWNGDTEDNLKFAAENFQKELSKIKGFYFDVAFFPVDARLEEHSAKGVNEFLHCVKVDHIVPMHMHGLVWRENKVVTKNGESKIWFPEQYGDKVTFEK